MPYRTHAYAPREVPADATAVGQLVDQPPSRGGRFGVAVRDMFSDAAWTPVEPVRARDWRDNGPGTAVLSSETSFD